MTEKKIHWLTKRLLELNKSKRQLAFFLDVQPARLTDLENGSWKFQASQIKKAAEYLEFDRTAFLDFISGDITEEELWAAKPPLKITEQDLQLLQAVKSLASPKTEANTSSDPDKQAQIPARKEQERQ